jgi:hypothetical protein
VKNPRIIELYQPFRVKMNRETEDKIFKRVMNQNRIAIWWFNPSDEENDGWLPEGTSSSDYFESCESKGLLFSAASILKSLFYLKDTIGIPIDDVDDSQGEDYNASYRNLIDLEKECKTIVRLVTSYWFRHHFTEDEYRQHEENTVETAAKLIALQLYDKPFVVAFPIGFMPGLENSPLLTKEIET